jgi:hypothetical protein
MENIGIFSGQLENLTTIGCILWAFGNFVVIWYIFPRFGILYQEKMATLGTYVPTYIVFRHIVDYVLLLKTL